MDYFFHMKTVRNLRVFTEAGKSALFFHDISQEKGTGGLDHVMSKVLCRTNFYKSFQDFCEESLSSL